MNRKNKEILLDRLEKHLTQLKENIEQTQKALQYYSQQATSSWSIAGERKHAETDLKLALDLFEKARKLQQEIINAPETNSTKVITPCFVVIRLDSEKNEEKFYFLETSLQIPDIKIISPSSPLGRVISNKKIDERFLYKITNNQKVIRGLIKDIN